MITEINQSVINAWMLCPERVRRRWFLNEVIPPGIAARLGTGFHRGAEVNHKAKLISGRDEPLDVITDAARDGYVESLKEGVFFPPDEAGTAKKQLSEGVDIVVSLASLYGTELAPKIMPELVEEKIYMEHPRISLPFSGIIDVLDATSWLPDLKTASKSYSQNFADSAVQMTLYDQLVAHKTGAHPRVLSFEVFVKTKTPKHQSIETKRTNFDFEVLLSRVELMLRSIQAGIFPPADPGSWICAPHYCGYWWTCPYIPAHKKIIPK